MIHAYDRIYLNSTQRVLGNMLEFAVYDLNESLRDFYRMFLGSGIATAFGKGDCSLIAGRSGAELAYEVFYRSGVEQKIMRPQPRFERTPEYWTGWALAYYQWESGRSFAEIEKACPVEQINEMYHPFHEMDIRAFCERMTQYALRLSGRTNLQILRISCGLSQSELAALSGVPLRTIQQYEQRQKSINRASVDYVMRFASVLCCRPEDLLETEEGGHDSSLDRCLDRKVLG